MLFRSKLGKIITSSLLSFSFGTMFTSIAVVSIGKFSDPNGTGGLETSSQPVFLADYSDFMGVVDEFPIDPNLDPDYLPAIEIDEEDLVFQDLDDDSFFVSRDLYSYSYETSDINEELFVESDSEFENLDTRTFTRDSAEAIADVIDIERDIPRKIAVDLVAFEDYDFSDLNKTSDTVVVEAPVNNVADKKDINEKAETVEIVTVIEDVPVSSETTEVAVTENASEENAVAVAETTEITEGEVVAKVEDVSDNTITPVMTESTTELYEDLQHTSNEVSVPSTPALTYQIYRVRVGDTIGAISQKYGLDNDTLFSVNEIKNTRSLSIGSYLKIPSMKGLLYTVKSKGITSDSLAKKFKVDAQKCALVNQKNNISDEFAVGSTVFIPDAKMDNETRSEIEGILWKKPLRNKYRVTSPYGWRNSPFNPSKRSYHSGIDLALPTGNPIYAASPGTVISTGYTNVYGNFVKIQHAGGYQTLYGHMSQIIAKKGQYVDTNTIIGKVGSTGQSTGPHLHFTLIRYGQTINPSSTGLYF